MIRTNERPYICNLFILCLWLCRCFLVKQCESFISTTFLIASHLCITTVICSEITKITRCVINTRVGDSVPPPHVKWPNGITRKSFRGGAVGEKKWKNEGGK